MSMARWTAADIPDLSDRGAVVTGANSGLGFQTALELARHGARVMMACRDQGRGAQAVDRVRALAPGAEVELGLLDLADLASVRRFTGELGDRREGLDLLVNNAGVMAIPHRRTADGFEMQLGTNHLGHFALTGLLWPLLAARPGARVVTISSIAHRAGWISFGNLQRERRYERWTAYGQAKLANLLFAFEVQRRADAADVDLLSMAAHPGYAATKGPSRNNLNSWGHDRCPDRAHNCSSYCGTGPNLQAVGPQMSGARLSARLFDAANRVFAQPGAQGALPSLYAATSPDARGGAYYGPDGFGEVRGYPTRVKAARRAYDERTARRLWQVSEDLTGVRYDSLDAKILQNASCV